MDEGYKKEVRINLYFPYYVMVGDDYISDYYIIKKGSVDCVYTSDDKNKRYITEEELDELRLSIS